MTARANRMTKRATGAESARPAVATQGAGHVRVFVEGFGRLGYDTVSLLSAAGLRASMLEDPDGRIPCAAVGAIFQRAMQERPMKNLGTRIAAETPMGAFPLIDYLILTSESVGRGLQQLSRYFRLIDAPATFHIDDDREPIRARFDGPPDPFSYEFGIVLSLLHLREETEHRFRPEYVSFAHRPDDVQEIERVLDCPVRAQASWSGWAMSRQGWNLPLRRRDPILRGVLERQAAEMAARLPRMDGLALEVRRALDAGVPKGEISVARRLGMSARTLQRRLADEGLSFVELLEGLRKEHAARYLADTIFSIDEIAYLLGYSEAAAFSRAFRRWFGAPPQGFRQAAAKKHSATPDNWPAPHHPSRADSARPAKP